jgi:hypothetical protein
MEKGGDEAGLAAVAMTDDTDVTDLASVINLHSDSPLTGTSGRDFLAD